MQSSRARNSLPLLSLNQTLTCTPLCSTVGVTGWVGVCLFTALFLTDHLSKDTRGCSPWRSRRDANYGISNAWVVSTVNGECMWSKPQWNWIWRWNKPSNLFESFSVALVPLKKTKKTKLVFMFSWFSTSVVYSSRVSTLRLNNTNGTPTWGPVVPLAYYLLHW